MEISPPLGGECLAAVRTVSAYNYTLNQANLIDTLL